MPISGKDKSSLDRVVGGGKDEQKRIAEGLERRFGDQEWSEDLRRVEREKMPLEIEAIQLANEALSALRQKYGLSAWEIPERNVHVLRNVPELTDDLLEGPEHGGRLDYENQWVAVVEHPSNLETIRIMFHEMIHFASYLSVEPESFGGLSGFAPHAERRLGLRSTDESGVTFFNPLNEAVTEILTQRLMEMTRKIVPGEWESLDRVRASQPAEKASEFLALSPGQTRDGEKLTIAYFDYPKERQALQLLIRKLHERAPQSGRDPEAWFDLFAGAMFNGHLLELARNIEQAFGQGAFRRLGECQTGEELLAFAESLETQS